MRENNAQDMVINCETIVVFWKKLAKPTRCSIMKKISCTRPGKENEYEMSILR